MDSKRVAPEEVLIPPRTRPDKRELLQLHFLLFEQHLGHGLPPAIIAKHDLPSYDRGALCRSITRNRREAHLRRSPYARPSDEAIDKEIRESLTELCRILRKGSRAPYYLLQGTEHCLSAALTYNDLYALELQDDDDLPALQMMKNQGKILDLKPAESLREMVAGVEDRIFDKRYGPCPGYENTMTAREWADMLAKKSGALPEYMRLSYLEHMTINIDRATRTRKAAGA